MCEELLESPQAKGDGSEGMAGIDGRRGDYLDSKEEMKIPEKISASRVDALP